MSDRIEIHGVRLDKLRELKGCADETRFNELASLLKTNGTPKVTKQAKEFLRTWMFGEISADEEGAPHLLLFLSWMESTPEQLDLSLKSSMWKGTHDDFVSDLCHDFREPDHERVYDSFTFLHGRPFWGNSLTASHETYGWLANDELTERLAWFEKYPILRSFSEEFGGALEGWMQQILAKGLDLAFVVR